MEDNRITDPDKILKKITATPSTAKLALGVAILSLIGFIFGISALFFDTILSIVLLITCSIFFIAFYLIYYFQKKNNLKKMSSVNLNEVKSELISSGREIGAEGTYFTKNYIMSHYYNGFIVIMKLGYFTNNDLALYLKNGKPEFTIFHQDILDEIVKRNSNVLVGNSKENKARYKELVNEYKNKAQ